MLDKQPLMKWSDDDVRVPKVGKLGLNHLDDITFLELRTKLIQSFAVRNNVAVLP